MVMGSSFCVLKVIVEIRKRGVYGISLIKRNTIKLGRFMETVLTSDPVQNSLVMWNVLVVNVVLHS